MTDVYIDPWLLGLPEGTDKSEVADRYVENLTDLHQLTIDGLFSSAISANASSLLEDSGCFPIADRVHDRLWPHKNDVLRIVNSMLTRLPSIEADDGIEDLCVDPMNGEWTRHYDEVGASAANHREELLARSVTHSDAPKRGSGPILLTTLNCASANLVAVECNVVESMSVTPDRESINGIHAGSVFLARCPKSMAKCIDPIFLWLDGSFEKAIKIAIHQSLPEKSQKWPLECPSFCLGKEFIDSVQALNFNNLETRARLLLRASVEAVLGLNLAATHWLRTTKAANSPQRERFSDKAKAWRRDVDHEFHLHYWKAQTSVELGVVVVHNDFDLPE